MAKPKPLSTKKLRAELDPARIPYDHSGDIPRKSRRGPAFQPRAMEALELGMTIRSKGYNIFVVGEPHLGRMYMVREFLTPRAAKETTPPDLVYVNNFTDRDRPVLLTLPSGTGLRLRDALSGVVSRLRKELPNRFEHDTYVKRRNQLLDRYEEEREKLLGSMETEASGEGFNLDMDDDGGLTLYPLVEGKILSEEEFEKLPKDKRQQIKLRGDRLISSMNEFIRRMTKEEQGLRESEQNLDREIMSTVLDEIYEPMAREFTESCDCEALGEYFKDMREDMLDSLDQFAAGQGGGDQSKEMMGLSSLLGEASGGGDDFFLRYEVNLFVDNSKTKGAPVVEEDHPTASNLLGCIEREAEMGTLVTDYRLVKAGALHRALGGYLLLHIEDVLQHPAAWEGLLRALRAGQARIEEGGEGQDQQSRTKSVVPDAVPVNTKIVLIGTDEMYEALLMHDDRFAKLFRIKAHMQETVVRNATTVKSYLPRLARIIDEAGLKPFDRGALAGIVNFASRVSEDQRKMTLKFPLVRELMIEASAFADMEGREMVDEQCISKAMVARDYRLNLYEEEFMEGYDRELVKVSTEGEAVGRVNGLSVTWYGDFEFGLPHQIACTVGVGSGGIVDLEREAELGGPIHTKAMMILKSYLLGLFAKDKPLVMTGSLCFEQSYAGVEGDSASGAELIALLSALSGIPVRLSMAMTGAVSQSGTVMAVGGVTRKVEGFFEVCRRRGLTGDQGVLLPADNVDQLMLRDSVVEAVQEGKFHIWPVQTVEQALELLMGVPAGQPLVNGGYTRGSVYDRVDRRLAELAEMSGKYRSEADSWIIGR